MYGFGTSDWENGSEISINYCNLEDVKRYEKETERHLQQYFKKKIRLITLQIIRQHIYRKLCLTMGNTESRFLEIRRHLTSWLQMW
jgi:hypothetical protein